MHDLKAFKNEFSNRQGIHFNSAGLSPISKSAAARVVALTEQVNREGSFIDQDWVPKSVTARETISRFLGATPDQLAFVPNVASGLSQAALGFSLKPQDTVVTVDQEYSSSFYPWKVATDRAGAKLVVISSNENLSVSLDQILSAIQPGVKLVGVSWVQFQTGTPLDLVAIGNRCREVGASFVVDGIQGLGQMPFSFQDLPIDCVVGAAHKWMCAPIGQGFMVCRDEFMKKLHPVVVGGGTFGRWGTFADPALTEIETVRKFEPGGLNFLSLLGLESATQVHELAGMEVIATEISRLSKKLREGMAEFEGVGRLNLITPFGQKGGTTSVVLPEAIETRFLQTCRDERIALAKRGRFVRFAIHAFSNEQEVDTVLGVLRKCFA